ncbi:MAG: ABC transporter permease [Candidatus Helarchaeota archaeon]
MLLKELKRKIRYKRNFKKILQQILAIFEKEFYLKLRYKATIIVQIINPLIQLMIFIFLFKTIFNLKKDYSLGYWNINNYILFVLIAFCLQIFKTITERYYQIFIIEKYWKTLSATLIAPVNKFSLLMGILISTVLINSPTFILLIIVMLILFPINLFYFLLFLFILSCIIITFASIGLLIGVFGISNETFGNYFYIILRFIFLFSCINYPKEIFPEFIQFFILLNPIFYSIDLLRLIWYLGLDPNSAIIFITPLHIIIFIIFTISLPIISIIFFNKIYKKYGITGY